jgi:hypothetical protein
MSERQSIQGGRDRPPWIAFSIVAFVAIAIAVAFFVAQNRDTQEREQREAREQARILELETGTACGALKQADQALASGNNGELKSAIQDAQRQALHALDTSGVIFGTPERLALFLYEDLKEEQRNIGEGSKEHRSAVTQRLTGRVEAAIASCDEITES